jgi:hypothetical protein
MRIEIYRRMIFVSGLIFLFGLSNQALCQKSQALKAHRHAGIGNTVGGDIPEFSMVETSLAKGVKKQNLITSRNRRYDAFTVTDTRLLVADRRTAKIFEIRGLPMEWRPFSDLAWMDNQTLVFDRWSQPHYGVHYQINVKRMKLMKAMPFPD